jgi:hypothetical protein
MKSLFNNARPDPVLAILFLAAFMFLSDIGRDTYDFRYADTFLVIPSWLPALVLGVHWLIYKAVSNRIYSIALVWVHYSLLLICYLLLFTGKPLISQMVTSLIFLLLLTGLIIFLVNISMAIMRKSKAA